VRALVLFLIGNILCFSAGAAAATRHAVLVLRPELTAEAVFGPRSPFAPLLTRAAIGVMNTAVPGAPAPASAYLTLGAGERVAAAPLTAAACFRSGSHLTSLGRMQVAERLQQSLRPRGGVAWFGVRKSASAPLVVLDLPPSFNTRRLATLVADLGRDPERDILLVSPYPPPGDHGVWDRLPAILGLGPDYPAGYLTSSTTRTPGLVANIDVAPSVLAALGVAIPPAMRGRVMRTVGRADAAALLRFAQSATLAQRAIVPLGIGIGIAAVVPLILALLVFWGRRMYESDRARLSESLPGRASYPTVLLWLPAVTRAALLLVAASPLALLLAPLMEPKSVAGLGMVVAGCATAGAITAVVLSHCRLRIPGSGKTAERKVGLPVLPGSLTAPPPPLLWLYGLTVVAVVVDLLLGGRLVARSPLSGFAVAGIRFYGVGNEYAGVLIGMGILTPLLVEERLARCRWAQAGLYLGLVALIGSPQYGANLGGPLAAAAGFAATLMLAVWPRRPLPALVVAAGALITTTAIVFLWDALRPPPARSHIGDFVHAVLRGGWPAAAPVLRGKAAMSLRILTSSFALVPIAVVAPLLALWFLGARRWLSDLFAHRPELRAATAGSMVAAWTALLCKDSGVVPWMFITASMAALLLDEQLRAPRGGSRV
jgi:hypothetical protein